jgi:pimeloyl-ACP methyl ester carboxylesterase
MTASYLTTADGLHIAYYEWGTEHRGKRPPVVLQHGFIANADLNWVQPGVVAALVDAGRHVVGVDARGHGASSAPHDPSYYGEAKMAADLTALFDLMDLSSVHLVGYSMGGIISLIAASEDGRVDRLVVGGIGAGVVEMGGLDTRAVPREALAEALLAEDPSTLASPMARGFRAFADSVGTDRFALAAQARSAHRERIALEGIHAPTMVLVGRDDPLAVRPGDLAAAIPNAIVEIVDGDHLGAVAVPAFRESIVTFLGTG